MEGKRALLPSPPAIASIFTFSADLQFLFHTSSIPTLLVATINAHMDWSTEITIGNLKTAPLVERIDINDDKLFSLLQ